MKIQICTGKSCKGRFSEYIVKRVESDKEKFHLDNLIVETCPCQGMCKEGPTLLIDGRVELHMNGIKASKMIMEKAKQKKRGELKGKSEHKFELKDNSSDIENMYLGK